MSLLIFFRYLLSSRSGSIIKIMSRTCILGVVIGLASFIVVLSVMNGFNRSIKNRYLSVEPHVVSYDAKTQSKMDSAEQTIKRQYPKLIRSVPFEIQDVFVKGPDGFSGAVAKGISRSDLMALFKTIEKGGHPLIPANSWSIDSQTDQNLDAVASPTLFDLIQKMENGDILVGADLARTTGVVEGDRVSLMPPESLLLPSGELPESVTRKVLSLFVSNVGDVDSRYIYYLIETKDGAVWPKSKWGLGFANPASARRGIEFFLKDPESYEEFKAALEIVKAGPLEDWTQRNSSLFLALRLEKLTISTFLSLSGIITCFTIISILILLITQKRRDIGILMTMGLTPLRAQRLFQWIGVYLFGFGLLGGVGMGLVISYGLSWYPLEVLPDIYYDRTLPSEVDLVLVLAVVVVALIVSSLSAWLPSKKASELSPVDAFRK